MIVLCVEDNGVGAQFESASTEKGCGQGLELHHAMLAAFNTEMHIESVHGQHTRVILSIPLSVVDWCTETLESQYAFQPVGAVTPDEDRETALNSHVHEMNV